MISFVVVMPIVGFGGYSWHCLQVVRIVSQKDEVMKADSMAQVCKMNAKWNLNPP